MLLIILSLVSLLVGIGLLIGTYICARKEEKEYGHYRGAYSIDDYGSGIWGIVLTVIGGVSTVILLIILSCTRSPISEQMYYDQMVEKREIIVYRLEHENASLDGNVDLYQDVLNFNYTIRDHKYWSDNIWIGIFHNQKIQDLEYIELPGKSE